MIQCRGLLREPHNFKIRRYNEKINTVLKNLLKANYVSNNSLANSTVDISLWY